MHAHIYTYNTVHYTQINMLLYNTVHYTQINMLLYMYFQCPHVLQPTLHVHACTLIPYLNIFQVSCQRKVQRIPTSCRCPTTLKTADSALLRWPRWPRPLTSRWGELCACGWTRCHSRNPTSCDSHVKAAWGMYFYSFCPFFKHPVSLGFIRQCCTRRLHSIIFPSLYNIKIKKSNFTCNIEWKYLHH